MYITLLGILAFLARENGLNEVANEIHDFIRRNRRILAELDEAHVRAVYGIFEYNREQANAIIDISRQVIDMVKRIINEILK